jgi:drug/metabolite transporter (DMT)-like permease
MPILPFLMFALFSSIFSVGKLAMLESGPYFITAYRMILAGFIMLPVYFFTRKKTFKIKKQHLLPLASLAIFNIFFTNALEFWGLQYLTAAKTCLIYSLSPFITALVAYCFLGEKMTKNKWIGLIISCLGFIPIFLYQSDGELEIGHLGIFSSAELTVIGAATSAVIGWVTLKALVENEGMPISLANAISMIAGGLISLACSLLLEDWSPTPIKSLPAFLKWSTVLLITSNLICYNMYGYLLKKFSATFMSLCGFSSPLFASLYGWFLLKEPVGVPFFLSCFIIFTGVYFFYKQEIKNLSPKTQL